MEVSPLVAAKEGIGENQSQHLLSNSNFCLVMAERRPKAGTGQMPEATSGRTRPSSPCPLQWDLFSPHLHLLAEADTALLPQTWGRAAGERTGGCSFSPRRFSSHLGGPALEDLEGLHPAGHGQDPPVPPCSPKGPPPVTPGAVLTFCTSRAAGRRKDGPKRPR